jgi:hypothetical protein
LVVSPRSLPPPPHPTHTHTHTHTMKTGFFVGARVRRCASTGSHPLSLISAPFVRLPECGRETPWVVEMCKIDGGVYEAMLGVELDMYLLRRRNAIQTISKRRWAAPQVWMHAYARTHVRGACLIRFSFPEKCRHL